MSEAEASIPLGRDRAALIPTPSVRLVSGIRDRG